MPFFNFLIKFKFRLNKCYYIISKWKYGDRSSVVNLSLSVISFEKWLENKLNVLYRFITIQKLYEKIFCYSDENAILPLMFLFSVIKLLLKF